MCQFLSLDRCIASIILSFDHSIFSSMSNYCDKLFARHRLSISSLSITLILNIYYYCSVSRTSLPILTIIIIDYRLGSKVEGVFFNLRITFLSLYRSVFDSTILSLYIRQL